MNNFEISLNNLNNKQRTAVETLEGPVLVIAGPGTGKTQVLALRIANIIKSTDASPSNILCLTFTESGVSAMRNRLITLIGKEAFYVRIHTFHSFCNEVIQAFPEKFAFAKELIQLDDLNRLKIIQEVIESLDQEKQYQLRPLHDKFFYQKDILSSIQTLKREGISAESLNQESNNILKNLEENPDLNKRTGKPTSKWLSNQKYTLKNIELSEIFDKYNQKLNESGFYDYEDMILFVINKLKEDDELLAYYQEKYLYILVDEYQDTNGSQNELLKILGNFDSSPNIFAVGDDDQAIYRFQGANVENLLFFEQQFENVKIIPITTNYRSSQLILDLASSSIKANQARLVNLIPDLSKDLKSGLKLPNNRAEVCAFSNYEIENKYIVEKIKELKAQGENYSDVAILYRKHADAEDIVETLLKADIPIKLSANKNSLDELIIQKFLNLLKVIQHSNEDINFLLFQVLFYDFLHLNRLDVFKLINIASLKRLPLFNLMLDLPALEEALLENPKELNEFANRIIRWREEASNLTLVQFIEKVADESGFISSIFREEADLDEINSLNAFYSYIRNINKVNKKLTLFEFLNDIELIEKNKIEISESDFNIDKEAVHLMTAHKSKGLEFKYVFIIKFYDGNWGNKISRNTIKIPFEKFSEVENTKLNDNDIDFNEEDDRRLFFVSLTRAKEQIFITYSKVYPSGNTTKEVSSSKFLFELDRNLIELKDTSDLEKEDLDYIKKSMLPSKLASPYSSSEEDYLKSVVKNLKLSATSLNDYIECPLKFKYNHLFRVPKPIHKSAILGSAIHYALENYFRKLKNGEKVDVEYMLNGFRNFVNKQLLGPEDMSQTILEGSKLITDYYNFYQASFSKPIEVEYAFKDKNIIFEIPNDDPIIIKGKLDRIDWLNPSEGGKSNFEVRVTDYKVKTPKSANEIKGLTKYSKGEIFRQLMFYKILGESDPLFKKDILSPKYEIKEICIDFIKPNSRGIYKREFFQPNDEDMQVMRDTIIQVVKKIRNLEFAGSEEYPLCGECEYCRIK